jgi:hypothetical protein
MEKTLPKIEVLKHTLPKSNMLTLSYYFDSREYNTFNILTAGALPKGFSVFGFIDLHGVQNLPGKRFDLTRFFLEYRLRYKISPAWIAGLEGVGIDLEVNEFTGSDNSLLRFGLTYIHHFRLIHEKNWAQIRYFPHETDGSGSQFSIILSAFLSDNFFIDGFLDYNINKDGDNMVISEFQCNYIFHKNFDLILEARYNEYEDLNDTLKGFGIGVGLKIKL